MSVRTVLFVVSEYGEFFNLLSLADDLVAAQKVHPIFAFKSDYGAIDRHSLMVEQRGYSWVSEKDPTLLFDMSQVDLTIDDYVPYRRLKVNAAASAKSAPTLRWTIIIFYLLYRFFVIPVKLIGLLLLPLALAARLIIFAISYAFRYLDQRRVTSGVISLGDLREPVKWRLRRMEAVFHRFDPAVVISGQDYPMSIVTIASKVAECRNIKTIIVPFSMTPTTKEIAESFAELGINRIRSRTLRRLMQFLLPTWIHHYRGRYYSRLPLFDIIVSERNKLSPPEPWTPNSGRGVIMAPSQQSVDYCLQAGIPASQLRLTGPLWSDDILSRQPTLPERREKLIRDVSLARNYWLASRARDWSEYNTTDTQSIVRDDKRLIIFSWPPNQWPRKATGFTTYEAFNLALVEMLAGIMHARFANVAISLHPTLVGTEFAETIRKTGLYITDADLIDIIDCADIFCATVSSTLMWSLLLDIPSVNFDIYRYGYSEFRAAGMLESKNIRQLRDQLMTLITDQAAYSGVADQMLATRGYWTIGDGQSRQRTLAEIEGMMRKSASKIRGSEP